MGVLCFGSSLSGPTTIDGEAGSGHETVGRRGEEKDCCAQFGDLPPPTERDSRAELFVFHWIVEQGAVHLCRERAGAEGVNGDAGSSGLERLRSHELDDPALTGGVGWAFCESDHPEDG